LHSFLGEVALSHDEYVEVLALLPNLSYTWANLEPVINFVPLFAKG